jgi:hypothetical protein
MIIYLNRFHNIFIMSSNTYRISNEQLLLVNILNTMYNDNLRHINSISETLNSLVDSNNQIRILLSQILNSTQNSYNNSRRNNNSNRRWENTSNVSERIIFNNRPYVVDSINEYTIPRNRRHNNSDEVFTQIFSNFLQPVQIYPTQSQIETATRRVRYCDISRPINTSCPISMEDFNDNDMVTVIRHCGHTFHTDSLMNWFRSNCRCPVCRYDIRDYNTTSPSEFFNAQNSNSSRTIDSSNNNLERINNQTTIVNESVDNTDHNNVDNLFNITDLLDSSGNFTNLSSDTIAMFLVNVLNRSRYPR